MTSAPAVTFDYVYYNTMQTRLQIQTPAGVRDELKAITKKVASRLVWTSSVYNNHVESIPSRSRSAYDAGLYRSSQFDQRHRVPRFSLMDDLVHTVIHADGLDLKVPDAVTAILLILTHEHRPINSTESRVAQVVAHKWTRLLFAQHGYPRVSAVPTVENQLPLSFIPAGVTIPPSAIPPSLLQPPSQPSVSVLSVGTSTSPSVAVPQPSPLMDTAPLPRHIALAKKLHLRQRQEHLRRLLGAQSYEELEQSFCAETPFFIYLLYMATHSVHRQRLQNLTIVINSLDLCGVENFLSGLASKGDLGETAFAALFSDVDFFTSTYPPIYIDICFRCRLLLSFVQEVIGRAGLAVHFKAWKRQDKEFTLEDLTPWTTQERQQWLRRPERPSSRPSQIPTSVISVVPPPAPAVPAASPPITFPVQSGRPAHRLPPRRRR
ncbi:hypothetical protein CALVIDRAFT_560272 [Calocera viscosa TUFC12733]|uniref:Uncharacterized protein n=1 Tax=Calocera viscosa (strain TUFC12733) TaxID=1330018 RepID=A0A167RJM1_CALVF|nr:hypothetical protein CALVIDRAFT_560272 [Calocera viscosa TUFC12733]